MSDAFAELRSDVESVFDTELLKMKQAANDATKRSETRSGANAAVVQVLPSLEVSGSKPAWLDSAWRKGFTAFASLLCLVGIVLTWRSLDMAAAAKSSATVVAAFGGVLALAALIIAFYSVAGYGEVKFSIKGAAQASPDTAGAGSGVSDAGAAGTPNGGSHIGRSGRG